jgi:RNA-directed DNA polymerase
MPIPSIDGPTWKTKLERIRELSAKDKTMVFNNLGHFINVPLLKEMYHQLDGNKAVGTDGILRLTSSNFYSVFVVAGIDRSRQNG